MIKQIELNIPPEHIHSSDYLKKFTANKLNINPVQINSIIHRRRSIDARRTPVFKLLVDVYIDENPSESSQIYEYKQVKGDKNVIIVGFGPAGMFAALRLIELGIKPVIFERGKDVRTRRRDLRVLQQDHIVNPDSNYCFGEGGAGTYSDGKLYTRSVKRGNVKKILEILIQHGADPDIKINSHPHIGSNKLPQLITAIRDTIINSGGEIHFNSRVTDFILNEDKLTGVIINDNDEYFSDATILATGHSARDIYYLLHKRKIKIELKQFSMGVRIEHPQELVNEIQYRTKNKNKNLPAASYKIATSIEERGVYSFCMCPGGLIVPSATDSGEVVVNGMSLSRRDSPFANSGIVVEITESDWKKYEEYYPFGGIKLQQEFEQKAFQLANNSQSAPAQRLTDFVDGIFSQSLPKSSYIPGLTSARLDRDILHFISTRLRKSIKEFNKKMKGFYSEDAIVVAAESRTSSPIRIPRNSETLMHVKTEGLFPSGEGAGYAGGIVSAAIDGENCANAVNNYLNN